MSLDELLRQFGAWMDDDDGCKRNSCSSRTRHRNSDSKTPMAPLQSCEVQSDRGQHERNRPLGCPKEQTQHDRCTVRPQSERLCERVPSLKCIFQVVTDADLDNQVFNPGA